MGWRPILQKCGVTYWVKSATRGHQKPSEATRGHQKPPEVTRTHQRQLLAASDSFWGFLAVAGGFWRLLVAAGGCWLLLIFLAAAGGFWLLLASRLVADARYAKNVAQCQESHSSGCACVSRLKNVILDTEQRFWCSAHRR